MDMKSKVHLSCPCCMSCAKACLVHADEALQAVSDILEHSKASLGHVVSSAYFCLSLLQWMSVG